MSTFKFRKSIPKAKLIYAFGLLAIGTLTLSSGKFYGVFSVLLSLYFFQIKGVEIDLNTKQYRETISLFNFNFGKWKNLPKIEYVSVFKKTENTRVWVSTASTRVTTTIIKVNLFYNTNRRIEAYETENKDDAFKKAKEIATLLNVDILDATERESKWL